MENSEQSINIRQNDYVDCNICEKSVKNCYLNTHIKTVHEGRKEHKCNFCGKYFSQSSSLNLHVKTIHKEMEAENNKCDICNKSFKYAWILTTHVKTIHEGLKEHKCKFCDKNFGQSSSLNRHVKNFHTWTDIKLEETKNNLYPDYESSIDYW